ncbi:hypothetical protein SCHPADRAFT_836759, partial [Schizopora paradoxa]
IDIVLPCHDLLETALKSLHDKFWTGRYPLSQILEAANHLSDQFTQKGELIALSLGSIDEDTWCIDNRGVLSLLLSKETYESLGLIGVECSEGHGQKFHLYDRTSKQIAKAKVSIKLWDERRSSSAESMWSVAFHTSNRTSKESAVTCDIHKLSSIIIPKSPSIHPPPSNTTGPERDESLEDWNSSTAELFEWTGMACLHSQRLNANDSVHSYVSSYEPPQPNYIGDLVHLRWCGLLSPTFVKSILNAITLTLRSAPSLKAHIPFINECCSASKPSPSFVSVTCNTVRNVPITYLSHKSSQVSHKSKPPRTHVDCWSLIINEDASRWLLAGSERS